MAHYLIDGNYDTVRTFETYNPVKIKAAIVEILKAEPANNITHTRDHKDKKWAGTEILDWYEINPANGEPSKLCYRGGRYIGYKSLVN